MAPHLTQERSKQWQARHSVMGVTMTVEKGVSLKKQCLVWALVRLTADFCIWHVQCGVATSTLLGMPCGY